MRVFFLNLRNSTAASTGGSVGNRWTFYIEKSEYFNKGFSIDNNNSSTSSTTPAKQSKLVVVLDKLKKIAVESRNEIDNAVDGQGLKGKLKQLLIYMESKIAPEESILQQFSRLNDKNILVHHHNHHHHQHPKNPLNHQDKSSTQVVFEELNHSHPKTSFQIHYPSSIGLRRAQRYSSIFIRQRMAYHRQWMIANSLLIPITFAATILPGPNIFLAYNLYRLYGHYQAYRGCINFTKYSKLHPTLLFKPSLELSDCLNGLNDYNINNNNINSNNNSNENSNSKPICNISNPYELLSNRLRIPGLYEFIKRVQLETTTK
ncbi:hypothetical protein CYY_003613 [Polysphondylium violaceum]|uniref:Transmembrane protein n=1 Tax=Polysphondylium violaceum TaxID=133409 RepID=A0A8J4PUH3_9MYCE|nr:hypothetical protein CYY_003613 [Polysphondylium violaceum]